MLPWITLFGSSMRSTSTIQTKGSHPKKKASVSALVFILDHTNSLCRDGYFTQASCHCTFYVSAWFCFFKTHIFFLDLRDWSRFSNGKTNYHFFSYFLFLLIMARTLKKTYLSVKADKLSLCFAIKKYHTWNSFSCGF